VRRPSLPDIASCAFRCRSRRIRARYLRSTTDSLTEAPRDYFLSRCVNSSADVATREAELAASRWLTPLGDVCKHLSPLSIGASAESDTASRLHGGVTGVAISASKGSAYDDMLSRVKGAVTLSGEILQVRKDSAIGSDNVMLPSCCLEEPRHGADGELCCKSVAIVLRPRASSVPGR
jgi:hypothetical protein